MSRNEGKFVKNGFFSVSADRESINGTLSLDGSGSLLHLWSLTLHDLFDMNLPERNTITGVLENQKKVSLIDCVKTRDSGPLGPVVGWQYCDFFPHYVFIGDRHFSHSEKFISEVSIVVDDASALFHDRFSFGTNMLKSNDIKTLSSLDIFNDKSFNENLVIAYYTGKEEIFSADTAIGNVSARNEVSPFGGQTGAHINNKISVRLIFPDPVDVAEMNQRIQKLLRFLEIIAGRPQNLLKVNIIDVDQYPPTSSRAYINMQPNRDGETENREPCFHDILVDAVAQPDKFEELIRAWLERDESWRMARARFSTAAWGKQRNYDPDRLIVAANMFDHLPKEALPKNAPLKQKIRHRSKFLAEVIGEHIPEIDCVTDAAVELRNFYVHGSESSRKREKLQEFEIFLADTLEFVFCASDLAELGWDIASWCREPKGHHPFCVYFRNYKDKLSKLKARGGI